MGNVDDIFAFQYDSMSLVNVGSHMGSFVHIEDIILVLYTENVSWK